MDTKPGKFVTNSIGKMKDVMVTRIAYLVVFVVAFANLEFVGQDARPVVLGRSAEAGIRLYEPKKKEKDRRRADPKIYPSLYKEARQKGTIIIFSAEWCGWCKRQYAVIPDDYRVVYADIDKFPLWRDLLVQWEIIKVEDKKKFGVPITVMMIDGLPVKTWDGFVNWEKMSKHVKKAKVKNAGHSE